MATEEQIIEALAALEHERWSGWEKYRAQLVGDVSSVASHTIHLDRWRRQRETSYSELTEAEQESDRVEARKTVALLRQLEAILIREK